MEGNTENGGGRRGSRWGIAAWSAAALILLLPLVAMQFTDEVNWNVADFAVFGALLDGMARAMFAMALAQALVAVIALIAGIIPAYEILALNGFFVALFVGSAGLFRTAARGQTPAGAGLEG